MHLSPIAGGGLTLPPPPSASAIPPLPDIDRSPASDPGRAAPRRTGPAARSAVAEPERVDAQRPPAAHRGPTVAPAAELIRL